jgi:hypothetical protein
LYRTIEKMVVFSLVNIRVQLLLVILVIFFLMSFLKSHLLTRDRWVNFRIGSQSKRLISIDQLQFNSFFNDMLSDQRRKEKERKKRNAWVNCFALGYTPSASLLRKFGD